MDLSKEHKEQRDWYNSQLRKLPAVYVQKAKEGYQKAWQEAYDAEPVEHKKSNAARRAANIRLRVFVEKILAKH